VTATGIRERQAQRTAAPRGWLRRLRATAAEDQARRALRRADEVLAVLEQAREILARGWVQNGWYMVRAGRSAGRAGLFEAERVGPGDVAGACVVGALALAVRERAARAELTVDGGPVIDAVWDALQERRGLGGPGVAGRAAPREVRLGRMRDLAQWNDRAGRTRDDVLGLVDLAISRVILTAMRPAGAAS
jgi:hypothetical protein